MPNRVLREGIVASPRIARVSWLAELFYRRLMSVVDDFGRYYASPMPLRAACYPLQLDKVKDAEIERFLAECVEAGLIRVYQSGGTAFLEMIDFKQHVRAKKSKFPDPTEGAPLVPKAQPELPEIPTVKRTTTNGHAFNLDSLPDEWRIFCRSERPDLDPQRTFASFRDYWIANANQRTAKKSDWMAAWRNWVRRESPGQQNLATTTKVAMP